MKDKAELFSWLINRRNYKKYLEIGVFHGETFKYVSLNENLSLKIGVDPAQDSPATHKMKSDDFFQSLESSDKFDIIFIDGMHLCDYVYKDIQNSLKHLNENGIIFCHDILPWSEAMQRRNTEWYTNGRDFAWSGDCWKAFAYYLKRSEHMCFTLDFDCGLGVIDTSNKRSSEQDTTCSKEMTEMVYEDYANNRNSWLNVKQKDYIFEYFGN